jgi:hypothetical protein
MLVYVVGAKKVCPWGARVEASKIRLGHSVFNTKLW